jgi:hypothetical protein
MRQRFGLLVGLLVAAPLVATGMEVLETLGGAHAALHGDVVRVEQRVHDGGDGSPAPGLETPDTAATASGMAAAKQDGFDVTPCAANLVHALRDGSALTAVP